MAGGPPWIASSIQTGLEKPGSELIFNSGITKELTHFPASVQLNMMRANRLQNALKHLSEAIQEAQAALEELRAEPDPLAVHIFISRRQYRNMPDTKSGKRHETAARMSWQTACELGYRGSLGEWERLMGAASKR